MEKILYLKIDESHIRSEEKQYFSEFLKTCENEGVFIAKETEATEGKGPGLFCIALCDTQRDIDEFAAKNIPVVAYEYDETIRLNNPYIILSFEGLDMAYLLKVHHRFFELPLKITETGRTVIRELSMEDLDALFRLYEGEHITDYMEPLYPYEEEKDYQKKYIKNIYGMYDYGMWLVIDKETGEVIGRAGVESRGGLSGVNLRSFRDHRDDEDTVELGYCIREDYQGQGYATEVCREIVRYTFENLGKLRIYAQVDEENIPSRKLLHNLGFQFKGAELFELIGDKCLDFPDKN